LKQAFAYCPYSPEAVYKYVNLLVNSGRVDDAMLVTKTCVKFDPENPAMRGLEMNLEEIKRGQGGMHAGLQQAQAALTVAEAQYRTNPGDLNTAFQLASLYLSLQRTGEANTVFEQLLARPDANPQTLLSVANAYQQLQNLPGMELALTRVVKVMPEDAEQWYNLARVQAMLHKNQEALKSLRMAVTLSNKRLAADPKARNLAADAATNPTFGELRLMPEFSKAVSSQEP
jgi:tetratricopeptide (TPR) repeat protein